MIMQQKRLEVNKYNEVILTAVRILNEIIKIIAYWCFTCLNWEKLVYSYLVLIFSVLEVLPKTSFFVLSVFDTISKEDKINSLNTWKMIIVVDNQSNAFTRISKNELIHGKLNSMQQMLIAIFTLKVLTIMSIQRCCPPCHIKSSDSKLIFNTIDFTKTYCQPFQKGTLNHFSYLKT